MTGRSAAGTLATRASHLLRRTVLRIPAEARHSANEQLVVTGAQVVNGVGNLLFALAAVRVLSAPDFAELAVFLALFLLVHLPTGSLTAGGAVDPTRALSLRRRAGGLGALGGLALAAVAVPASVLFGLRPETVVLLALTLPETGMLALEVGPLYGLRMYRRAALSQVLEPVVRLGVGVPLALQYGAVGAGVGVVLGAYAKLAVAAFRGRDDPRGPLLARPSRTPGAGGLPGGGFGWTSVVFLLLAVIQQQDLLLAKRLLPDGEAALFAVLSTLGGAAVFATVKIPTVLLPRATERSRQALLTALVLATALSGGVVVVVGLFPDFIVGTVFGERYLPVARFALPYMIAMGLFALSRVVVAYRTAGGGGRIRAGLLLLLALLHAGLIAVLGDDAAGVAHATLLAAVALAAVVVASEVRPLVTARPHRRAPEADGEALRGDLREPAGRPGGGR